MSLQGWYYLHTNGELIYKRDLDGTAADIRESDFARALWPLDPTDRLGAWAIVVEALAAGANRDRVNELAVKWGCNDSDAAKAASVWGARLFMDGDQWCATRSDFQDLATSPAGFGKTALEALAALAKELGYRPSKMWGASFGDLLKVAEKGGPGADPE